MVHIVSVESWCLHIFPSSFMFAVFSLQEVIREVEEHGKMVTKKLSVPWMTDYKWTSYEEVLSCAFLASVCIWCAFCCMPDLFQVGQLVKKFGAGLATLGLKPKQKISIFANTRYEWQVRF
jgi:hypothetical protein